MKRKSQLSVKISTSVTKKQKNNRLIKRLEDLGFQQLIKEATHFAGGHIDHIYVNHQAVVDVSLYSPYYCAKDHDALLAVVKNLDIIVSLKIYTKQ